jgi:hypothetical protein
MTNPGELSRVDFGSAVGVARAIQSRLTPERYEQTPGDYQTVVAELMADHLRALMTGAAAPIVTSGLAVHKGHIVASRRRRGGEWRRIVSCRSHDRPAMSTALQETRPNQRGQRARRQAATILRDDGEGGEADPSHAPGSLITGPSAGTSMLERALMYGARGFRIFPLHELEADGGCSCGRSDCHSPCKHPRTPSGVKEGTSDLTAIRQWWARWPEANIGLATGAGLLVLDVDGVEGIESLRRLRQEHGELPPTLSVRTGRADGEHRYYSLPAGLVVRNASGTTLGRGLDVRGDGGYVCAPPSVHHTGRRYERLPGSPQSMADAPGWLIAILTRRDEPAGDKTISSKPDPVSSRLRSAGHAVLTRAADHLRALPREPGHHRGDQFYGWSRRVGEAVGAGAIDHATALDALGDAAFALGLSESHQAWRSIENGLRDGATTPMTEADLRNPTPIAPNAVVGGAGDSYTGDHHHQMGNADAARKRGRYDGRRMDLGALLALPRQEQRWRVDGVVRDGTLTIISGKAGSGKSWVGVAFAYGVVTGRLAGGLCCEQGRAVVFDAEMGADLYADRLREAGLTAAFPVYDAMGLDLANDGDLGWFEQVIRDERANYVMIDSLRRLAPKAKEKDSDDMALIVARAARLSRTTGAGIVVIHHQGDSDEKLYRGSTGIIDQADALFGLLRVEGEENVRKLTCGGGKGKMRYAVEPADRWLRLMTADGVIVESVAVTDTQAARRDAPPSARDRYVEQLRIPYADNPRLTQASAAEIVGVAKGNQSAREALEQLRAAADASAGDPDHGQSEHQTPMQQTHEHEAEIIVGRFIREFDAVELASDCADPLGHARDHAPHPITGRPVCHVCHPLPAAVASSGGRP